MQAHSQELIEDYRKAIDQIIALRARVAELEDALIWCSGSSDFGPGGQAHDGWMKVCHPLIHPKP